ncbi:methionine/alanine import family NSS transporter small subunit [Microbacterium sp. NPDC055521]
MTPTAVVMMIVAMVTVWGGLAVAVVNLVRHPEVAEDGPAPPAEL